MTDDGQQNLRRNFLLGVANGVIFMAGSSLLGPAVILPQFLSTIFESKMIVGIGAHLIVVGWSLPQVVIAYFFRSFRHKKPVYIIGNSSRMALIGVFLLCFLIFQNRPRVVGILFFVLMGSASLVAGFVGLAYQDIVARVIPSEKRGMYIAYRAFGGTGIMALVVGLFAKHVLDNPAAFPYPGNYLLIFTVAWIMMSVGVIAFSLIREPAERDVRPRARLRTYIFELYLIVKRDRDFRRYLVVRMVRACEGLAIPFYIVYARYRFGLCDKAVGTFLLVGIVATLPAAIFWGKLSDRRGSRIVIISSCLTSASAAVFALGIVIATSIGILGSSGTAVVWILAPIFALVRAASVGGWIGLSNYVMDTAPPRRRPLYLGLATSMQGLLLIVIPATGGIIIDIAKRITGRPGYWIVFFLAAVAVTFSAFMARGLHEPRRDLAAASAR